MNEMTDAEKMYERMDCTDASILAAAQIVVDAIQLQTAQLVQLQSLIDQLVQLQKERSKWE